MACGRCGSNSRHLTPQKGFPIITAAITCMMCGQVIEYLDNLLIFSVQDALVTKARNPFVLRGHTASAERADADLAPTSYEVAKELVLMGIEQGLPISEIAEVLHLDPLDVSRLAGAAA